MMKVVTSTRIQPRCPRCGRFLSLLISSSKTLGHLWWKKEAIKSIYYCTRYMDSDIEVTIITPR